MGRNIPWDSGCFDEIELVYEKASEEEASAKILSELETGALAEARAHCDMLCIQGRPVTPEQFDAIPEPVKESFMAALSNVGLAAFSAPLNEAKITVRLSPRIQEVRCCTAFSILNRLEKLDGAYNVRFPQATLEIQVPLGGKRGLIAIEMLISMLYPWLNVREVSTNETAVALTPSQPAGDIPKKQEAGQKEQKPGFWEKLFGKRK